MSGGVFAEKSAGPAEKSKGGSRAGFGDLRIGEPDDAFEREADLAAEEVMAGGRPKLNWSLSRMSIGSPPQRKCACGGAGGASGECEECNRKENHESTKTLQRKAAGPSESNVAPPIVHEVLNSPGEPLDQVTREFFEARFGHDFSSVRVHTDTLAAQSATRINSLAYSADNDLVFAKGHYAPETQEGRRILAHELMHVVQHNRSGTSPFVVRRRGRTFLGFLSNIFHFWDYSGSTLDAYLKTLDREDQIQGDDDSDDIARQIVREWKESKSKFDLTPKRKILLVREMLDGVVSGADQERIMDLLEGSTNSDLQKMFKILPDHLTYDEIHSRFGGEKQRLEFFEARVLRKLDQYESPDPAEGKSLEGRLEGVEKQSGLEFRDLSLTFHLAAGKLYKSFLADLAVPEGGANVTVKLTRSHLHVEIRPWIIISVIWPFSNSFLNGFTLTFDGLKLAVDIDPPGLISGAVQEKVNEYLKGLLAGTRFEDPAYNPVKDPHLVSELENQRVIGDLDRIRYNVEKQKPQGDSNFAEGISGIGVALDLIHKSGRPIPSTGWDIVITPGTPFRLAITTSGTAAQAMKKTLRLERLDITSSGIFLYRGKEKIAMLTEFRIDRGLAVTLGGVKSFVDLKEIMKQESPDWLKGLTTAATDLMKKYDDTVDWWNNFITLGGLLGNPGKSDVATAVAAWGAEFYLRSLISGIVREQWPHIKAALGVTDQQIEDFLGLPKDTGESHR